MAKQFLVLGALLAATAVAAGAFGAHVLKDHLPVARLESFEVAVRYQLFHALALLLVGMLLDRRPSRVVLAAGWVLLAGVLLFSGCIYAYLATESRLLMLLVPVGGSALILGWLILAAGAWQSPGGGSAT